MLQTLTNVQPVMQMDPPVRDMDEALETFGPGADGVEPLLATKPAVDVITFHKRAPSPRP